MGKLVGFWVGSSDGVCDGDTVVGVEVGTMVGKIG